MIPVIGEAVPIPFNEQIEIDEWHWELKYDEQASGAKGASPTAAKAVPAKTAPKPAIKVDELIRSVSTLQTNRAGRQEERDRKVRELIEKAVKDQNEAVQSAGDAGDGGTGGGNDDKNKLTFTFKKDVDAATTQLLNSMKAGDVMPRAILTLFHRSANAPVTFVVTFGNVTLVKYDLSVETSETMSDMKESWTANFETVDYVYQNRPAASGPNGVTKGTARVFKMKLFKSPF